MAVHLKKIAVGGFKSFTPMVELELRDITVLIGANAAGKSNLVSFFAMTEALAQGRFQKFVAKAGGPAALLTQGRDAKERIIAEYVVATGGTTPRFTIDLMLMAGDRLLLFEEQFYRDDKDVRCAWICSLGHEEAAIGEEAARGAVTAGGIADAIAGIRTFHLNDTSPKAGLRRRAYSEDAEGMVADGSNLAAVIHRLKAEFPDAYDRLLQTTRMVWPRLDDFAPRPAVGDPHNVVLNWRENGSDHLFGPHQLSDGVLRFAALASVLLAPPAMRPGVIVLDEPELGLHPFAISVLASLVRSASCDSQIVLATQSRRLVDEFLPEDIVVVERGEAATEFRRLDAGQLAGWLEEYSVGELWEKNVFGGRPGG